MIIERIKSILQKKDLLLSIYKILIFGLLSVLLGQIKFYIPGVEGGLTDLREIPLLIGVFYFRHWLPLILISIITSFNTPEIGIPFSNFAIHAFSLVITYFIYQAINKIVNNRFVLSAIWFFVVIIYFYLVITPAMTFSHLITGMVNIGDVIDHYLSFILMLRLEMVATAAVTALYLLNFKTTILLVKQNSDLLISKKKVEKSEQLKTSFLQNLSHEIRTPMNAIVGFSHLLENEKFSDEQSQEYLNLIVNSSSQLLGMVDDIVEASEIETNQLKLYLSNKKVEIA